MHVIHASAECYPVAKVGGLADVVGALPKFLKKHHIESWVVIPKYDVEWIRNHNFETVHEGVISPGGYKIGYKIQKEETDQLGFPLYVVEITHLFSRPGIYLDPESGYGYWDEFERYLCFQVAILDWLKSFSVKPDLIHCHDHHTAFMPMFMSHSPAYHEFTGIPSVLTIHNAQYHGWYGPEKRGMFPVIDPEGEGYLYWDGKINALGCGLRTCWQLTTVSPTYMEEMQYNSNGLEALFAHERPKSIGIINGIDTDVWNPRTDPMIAENFDRRSYKKGTTANKTALCSQLGLNPEMPVFSFIGRFVAEKGADMLPDLLDRFLGSQDSANFIILGTGVPEIQFRLKELEQTYPDRLKVRFAYNEPLAHQIYAGSDFMFMPSRVEPCGLNQMYAMRYGTLPIVREVGGLKDTVIDFDYSSGYGITFRDFTLEDAERALQRGVYLYGDEPGFRKLQRYVMGLDFSWERSAGEYKKMYTQLLNRF